MSTLTGNTYDCGNRYTVAIGGGITTSRIHQVLRLQFLGGIKADECLEKVVVCGNGPVEFVTVDRNRIKPECTKKITFGDIVEWNGGEHGALTYEAALQWLITDPCRIFLDPNKHKQNIIVMTHEPIVIKGERHAMFLEKGLDGPMIYFFPVELDYVFPRDHDFLSAQRIGHGNPFCS